MNRLIFGLLVTTGFLAGCANEEQQVSTLKIAPRITRVTGLHFDSGDCIGLSVMRVSGEYANNQMMTYDGSFFTSAGFLWYTDSDETSTLTAYYPYDENGVPSEFSVATDQTAGCTASNILAAVKTDVRPTASAVGMTFASLMADILISVTNKTDADVTEVTVSGACPTAELDFNTTTATAKAGVDPVEIKTFPLTAGSSYEVILVPQRAALTFTVATDDGETYSKTLSESLLESNKQYTLAMTLTMTGLDLTLSGDIENWQPGGELGQEENGEVLSYQGEDYRTTVIDGRVWMAENMRYVPDEKLLYDGVRYPCQYNTETNNPDYIKAKGMLYTYATATGGVATVADGLVRGICPEGWHIPDETELSSLLTASVGEEFFACAGYWNANLDKYSEEVQAFIMGVTSGDVGKRIYLWLLRDVPTEVKPVQETFCVSLRCVKDTL